MLHFFLSPNDIEIGCDEAGRGCLAGPVFAAAVIWPQDLVIDGLNDSKQISESKRNEFRIAIEQNCNWAVGVCNAQEIDKINILNASILAMHKALDLIQTPFDSILVDGNRFKKYKDIKYKTIVKGDSKFLSIAAASILAKTHRDEFMEKIHQEHPNYHWNKNKGYPTKDHREAIRQLGITEYHRKTFRLLPSQLELDF